MDENRGGKELQQTVTMESTSGKLGRHVDPLTSAKLPTRSLCCPSEHKTRILYQVLLLGSSRRTGSLKFPWQLHGAQRDFLLPLAGVRANFPGLRRTNSERSNWLLFDTPLFYYIRNSHPWFWRCLTSRSATMITTLTGIFGSATAQDNLIPTSIQITHDMA